MCLYLLNLKKKLQTNNMIKLLYFLFKFLIINDALKINISKSSKFFRRSKTKKSIIKRFVDLFKNCTKNQIYKKFDKVKILIETSCFLQTNHKKSTITKKDTFNYEFIDVFNTNIKQKNIWFSLKYEKKTSAKRFDFIDFEETSCSKKNDMKSIFHQCARFLNEKNHIKKRFNNNNVQSFKDWKFHKNNFEKNQGDWRFTKHEVFARFLKKNPWILLEQWKRTNNPCFSFFVLLCFVLFRFRIWFL